MQQVHVFRDSFATRYLGDRKRQTLDGRCEDGQAGESRVGSSSCRREVELERRVVGPPGSSPSSRGGQKRTLLQSTVLRPIARQRGSLNGTIASAPYVPASAQGTCSSSEGLATTRALPRSSQLQLPAKIPAMASGKNGLNAERLRTVAVYAVMITLSVFASSRSGTPASASTRQHLPGRRSVRGQRMVTSTRSSTCSLPWSS